jgi:hypothetical protein
MQKQKIWLFVGLQLLAVLPLYFLRSSGPTNKRNSSFGEDFLRRCLLFFYFVLEKNCRGIFSFALRYDSANFIF